MSALNKLPPIKDRVWRGVNGDISKQYSKGTVHVWWGVSSCTEEVVVTDTFLDKKQPRTLFNIKCYNGKSIQKHSEFGSQESETILAPGTFIRVVSQSNPAENLHIVQCEQIEHASVLYLIWMDPNVNKFKENLDLQDSLRKIFGKYLLTYERPDECERFIGEKKNDLIILIVSGSLGQLMVPKIHDEQQLKSVIVYCMDKERNEKWANHYEKVC